MRASLKMPGQRIQNPGEEQPDMEEPDSVAAQARRYKHTLLLLLETIRRNHPSETHDLIDAIRGTRSVPEAADLLMRLSEFKETPDNRINAGEFGGDGTQS
ncbi:hypothetical protein BDV12DRAFT_69517 [Aspergillus spectabilis]